MLDTELEMMTEKNIQLSIGSMSCAGCVASVERALNSVSGVENAAVNFSENTAEVSGNVSAQALIDAVVAAGYEAAELKGTSEEAEEKEAAELAYYRSLLKKALVAGIVATPLMGMMLFGAMPLLEGGGRVFWGVVAIASLFVLVYSGGRFFTGAWKAFKVHNANMDTLIALGTGTAWAFSTVIVIWPDIVPAQARHLYFE